VIMWLAMEESLGSQAIGFADSDYARNDTNRRSVSGYIVYVNGGPVAWKRMWRPCTVRCVVARGRTGRAGVVGSCAVRSSVVAV
jgi:hypothetical protein